MSRFKLDVITAVAACVVAVPVAGNWLPELSHRQNIDLSRLAEKLSPTAKIYYPGSAAFDDASSRWSVLDQPRVNAVVVPGTENDVAETVAFANHKDLPFLAFNGAHGSITTLGAMDHGIEIYLNQLNSIEIAADGKTATFGGGVRAVNVTDTLWAAGKQTVTGTCECVSVLGPALGGGHGWLQGHHGLVADQFVSMNIVLADGTLQTIDASSDLFWAMKGAGHNFGIVTSLTSKIYDIQHSNWAIETLIFTGDKVEAVYQAANDHLLKNGTQPAEVINWSYWLNNPEADPDHPIIIFFIIQEGVDVVDTVYTQPFHDIGPLSITPATGTYTDLAGWTEVNLASAGCQKAGLKNPRFPLYLESYNVPAQRAVYDLFAAATNSSSPFSSSIFMFEGYSTGGVHAVPSDSTAFAFRSDNLLVAPLITYAPAGPALDEEAAQVGEQLRQVLHATSGEADIHAYVNYAFGAEGPKQWYGSETWRQSRLQGLKKKYDPAGKFSFYGPIA